MRPLTDREKRTVRFAGIGIAIYLALFGGFRFGNFLKKGVRTTGSLQRKRNCFGRKSCNTRTKCRS